MAKMVVMERKNISNRQAGKVLARRDPYIGIVLKEINGNLKTLLEGHDVIEKRIDRFDGRMGKVEVKLEKIEVKIDSLAYDINWKGDKKEIVALKRRVAKPEA
jgi:hypothetical protein